jgi:DNA-binding NarL/FixJ family response regulator
MERLSLTTESLQENHSQTSRTSIIVVDSQVLFRAGIRRLLALQEGLDVLGDTGNADEALSQIENLSPRIVMLDASLTLQKGMYLAEVIHRRYPAVSVILLTQEVDEQQIFLAMKAGVAAPLSKSAPIEEMVTVIRRVSQGDLPMVEDLLHRPSIAALVQQDFQSPGTGEGASRPLIASLAGKESEILTQLAQGRSADEIAAAMNMNPRSLKNALSSALIKLASNKQTLSTIAARLQGP